MAPMPLPDVSEPWAVEKYTDKRGEVAHEKLTIEHSRTGVSIFVRELPNGAALQLRVPADLPGGFEGVHEQGFKADEYPHPLGAAVEEAERHAAQYDQDGTWLVEGKAVLH